MEYGRGPSSFAAGLGQGFRAEVRQEGQEALAGWVVEECADGRIAVFEVSQAPTKHPGGNRLEAQGCGGLREAEGSIVQATGTQERRQRRRENNYESQEAGTGLFAHC